MFTSRSLLGAAGTDSDRLPEPLPKPGARSALSSTDGGCVNGSPVLPTQAPGAELLRRMSGARGGVLLCFPGPRLEARGRVGAS